MAAVTYKLIGKRLKSARLECGLTQKQVSEYLGNQRNYISYVETGARPVDMITLSKLADLYGYSLDFFVENDPVKEETDLEQKVHIAFRNNDSLSVDDLKTIAWLKRFAFNLDLLNKVLEEG